MSFKDLVKANIKKEKDFLSRQSSKKAVAIAWLKETVSALKDVGFTVTNNLDDTSEYWQIIATHPKLEDTWLFHIENLSHNQYLVYFSNSFCVQVGWNVKFDISIDMLEDGEKMIQEYLASYFAKKIVHVE